VKVKMQWSEKVLENTFQVRHKSGAFYYVVGWGTMLQAGRTQVLFLITFFFLKFI
jgi:hypothetical protein